MDRMEKNVGKSKSKTLEVALTYSTKALTTPKNLDDFNTMR
jgi:hypothetical protein